MERFTPACAKYCTMNTCTLPVEALNPLISAENVCRGALEASQPRKGIPLASSLIEQAIEKGDMKLLDRAEEVMDQSAALSPYANIQALPYQAYLPLFAARVERRHPEEDDLLHAFGRMQHGNDTYLDLLTMTRKERLQEVGIGSKQDVATISGRAGESIALYWSLYGAVTHGRTLLYPSAYREDNPPNPENSRLHKFLTHDVHTFDPNEGDERKIFDVKLKDISPKGHIARQIKPVIIASQSYIDLLGLPNHSMTLNIVDVLNYTQKAQRSDAKEHLFSLSLREDCSKRLEHSIRTTDPIPSTYTQQYRS